MAVARALCAAASVGVFGTGAPEAWASPKTAELSVARGPGAEDCPDTTALQARVEQITGTRLEQLAATEPRLALGVSFSREGDSYRAAIRTQGPKEGERSLEDEGPTCVALAEAVGVTLALLLDRVPRRDVPAPVPPQALATIPGRASIRWAGWIGVSGGPV